jgi:hypothetical protein
MIAVISASPFNSFMPPGQTFILKWRMQTKEEVSPEQLQLWFEEIMTAATRICEQYGIGPSAVRLPAPADQQKKAS